MVGARKDVHKDVVEGVQKKIREDVMYIVQGKAMAPGTFTILSPVSFSFPPPGKTKLLPSLLQGRVPRLYTTANFSNFFDKIPPNKKCFSGFTSFFFILKD